MSQLLKLQIFAHIWNAGCAVYMKIAEPRVKRLIYFVIYILLGTIGAVSAFRPNERMATFLGGQALVHFYGILIVAGALVCLISVLPGIWVFERAGLVGLGTGIVLYVATLIIFGASPTISFFPIIIILVFVLRWLDIKDYLLAPRKG
ncbi:membrane protein [Arthrobacter phage Tokki]|nr:membrane protein [Arthrobacter phage Tokki]